MQGAYNLYKSYLKVKSEYPFYCATWKQTNTKNFNDMPIITIPKIVPHNKRWELYNLTHLMTINKIGLWTLNFDYIFYLDCDMILYENIDDIINKCLEIENNDFIIEYLLYENNPHDYFFGGCFFFKPNKDIFIKAMKYIDISINDEELFTYLYDKNEINITDAKDLFHNLFHFKNWNKQQKYWETELGGKIYNLILENPKVMPYIKEIQELIN